MRNERNEVIGSGVAGLTGDPAKQQHDRLAARLDLTSPCHVEFSVSVPRAQFYQVMIGTHGGPAYSYEQLQAMNFTLRLTLH